MKTKFELKDMLVIGLTFVVTVIGISYGMSVTSDVNQDMCNYNYDQGGCFQCASSEPSYNASSNLCMNASGQSSTPITTGEAQFNATTDGLTALAKLPEKMPLIATVVIASIIIGVLVRYLYVRFN